MLFPRHPLLVDPALAAVLGLREAILVQQLHYWLERSTVARDQKRWTFNSYAEWRRQFPFLSERQLSATFRALERPFAPTDADDPRPARGPILRSRQDLNRIPSDRTKWYTLDYAELLRLNAFAEAICRACEDDDPTAYPPDDEDDPFFVAQRRGTTPAPRTVTAPTVEVPREQAAAGVSPSAKPPHPAPTTETFHSAHTETPPNPDPEEIYRQVRKEHFTEYSSLLYHFLGGDLQGKPLDDWLSELAIHAKHGHAVTREQVAQAVTQANEAWKRAERAYPRTITWVINALKDLKQTELAPPPPPPRLRQKLDPQAQRTAETRRRVSPLDALKQVKKQVSNSLHPTSPLGT
jgi:hypothetical protein